jgi:hypothetical protein
METHVFGAFLKFFFNFHARFRYYLNFARVGGLQSQGAKGEAVVGYREPLATLNLKSSGTPEG